MVSSSCVSPGSASSTSGEVQVSHFDLPALPASTTPCDVQVHKEVACQTRPVPSALAQVSDTCVQKDIDSSFVWLVGGRLASPSLAAQALSSFAVEITDFVSPGSTLATPSLA